MAATLDLTTYRAEDVRSTKKVISGIYTGPASYATGGDALLPAEVKLGQIHFFDIEPPSNGSVVVVALYDYTNFKVKWFDMAGAEIAAATALNTYTARFEAVGI
jgi:hypothetical protein